MGTVHADAERLDEPVVTPRRLRCQLWFADIGAARSHHESLLDPAERARRASFCRAADQARFTVSAALLRLIVAGHTGIAPDQVPVDRSCRDCGKPHGKPRVVDCDLQVSGSHSMDQVVLAITDAAPVGVDIEAIAERDIEGLTRLVLAESERIESPAEFFTYWCRKESAVKATGDGLRVPLRRVVVSGPDEPARLISYDGVPLTASMCDVAVASGYAGALTVLADGGIEIERHDGAELLGV